MSEPKAINLNSMGCYNINEPIYLKSEADKALAEKDAKILALDAEVAKQKHHAKLFFDERNYAETQLRHSNRKRCLAMARWCETRHFVIRYLQADKISNDENYIGTFDYIRKEYMIKHYFRWANRWLALAEEPTWAKFLQLIRKEVK